MPLIARQELWSLRSRLGRYSLCAVSLWLLVVVSNPHFLAKVDQPLSALWSYSFPSPILHVFLHENGGDLTWCLVHTRQVVFHWATPSPTLCFLEENGYVLFTLKGLASFFTASLSTLISYAFINQFIHKICTCGYLFYILDYYSIQLWFVLTVFQLCPLGLLLLAPCLLEMSPPLRRFLNGSLLSGTDDQMLQAHLIFHIPFLESTSIGHWRILIHQDLGLWGVGSCGELLFLGSVAVPLWCFSWLTAKWGLEE